MRPSRQSMADEPIARGNISWARGIQCCPNIFYYFARPAFLYREEYVCVYTHTHTHTHTHTLSLSLPYIYIYIYTHTHTHTLRFLLPGGLHFITSFGNLSCSILWTCPHHWSYLVLISSKRDLTTFIFCLIIAFLILSFLEIRAERRQKSISVELSNGRRKMWKHCTTC